MDLWIRSQNKKALINCNDIAIQEFIYNEIPKDEYCYNIVGYFDKESEYEILGSYKTKERALEVLDEIEERICLLNASNLAIGNTNNLIAFGRALGEEKTKGLCYPYEMPKE